jgi:hypothetical protein
MLKPVIAAVATLAIAGSTLVYAQQRFDGRDGFGNGGPRAEHRQHHRFSADDISAFADAHIAAIKAGLELTPDQAKNWPAYEGALRSMTQLRMQRLQARQAGDQQSQVPSTPFDRLQRRADAMAKRATVLKQIADTGAPLYQSLTDAQKNRFAMLTRMLRPHREHAANDGMGGGWRQGRGDGRDGHGWGQGGRRFGQDGQGWGHGEHQFGQNGQGPGNRMHNLMSDDDQDSQL